MKQCYKVLENYDITAVFRNANGNQNSIKLTSVVIVSSKRVWPTNKTKHK